MLGWPPAAFWAATPSEFWAAFDGWRRVNCVYKDDGALSEDEIARLDAMKRRFRDCAAARRDSVPAWRGRSRRGRAGPHRIPLPRADG